LQLSGFWDEAVVESYDVAMVAAQQSFKSATIAFGGYSVLVDIRQVSVLTKVVGEKLQINIQKYSRDSRNWVVLIEKVGLLSVQGKRIAPNAHFFTSEAEAIDWILNDHRGQVEMMGSRPVL
jgi:hypothetical protein